MGQNQSQRRCKQTQKESSPGTASALGKDGSSVDPATQRPSDLSSKLAEVPVQAQNVVDLSSKLAEVPEQVHDVANLSSKLVEVSIQADNVMDLSSKLAEVPEQVHDVVELRIKLAEVPVQAHDVVDLSSKLTEVPVQAHNIVDLSSKLAEIPEQKSSLSSLETVTCALGSETSLNQAPYQSENPSSDRTVKSEDTPRNATVVQDNEMADADTKSTVKGEESGTSQSCLSHLRVKELGLKPSVTPSQTVNETGEHADIEISELDILDVVRNKIRSNQKRKELNKSKTIRIDSAGDQKAMKSNVKPKVTVRSRKPVKQAKSHRLSVQSLENHYFLKQKPSQRKKTLKVDKKHLEERMTCVRAFCDEETTEYVTELYQYYKTSTVAEEDNRITYVLKDEEESKGKHSQNYPYSNIIFFPDKSKGAAPKRYGPKRLGSLYDTNHAGSEAELADTESSSLSESDSSSTRKLEISKQVPKTENKTKMPDIGVKDSQGNGEVNNNVDSAVPGEKSKFEKSPPVFNHSPLKVADCETPNDLKDTKDLSCNDTDDEHVKRKSGDFNTFVSNIKPVDEIESSCLTSNNSQNSSVGKECREKLKPKRSCIKEKKANQKENIDQGQLSVSYHVPVKTAVSDLQSSVAPDLDWSRLRSRQARYAVQLRSVKTHPGEDNRMVLEFNLPAFQGQFEPKLSQTMTGARKTHRCHTESDFNSVVNDFDDHSIESADISLNSNEIKMIEDRVDRCSACYSEEIVERYGAEVRFLRRKRTNIDEDNRVILEGNKAILANFEDEDASDKSDDDSSIPRSRASSGSLANVEIVSRISSSSSSDDESISLSIGQMRQTLHDRILRHMDFLTEDTEVLDISRVLMGSIFDRHDHEVIGAQKAGGNETRKPDIFKKYCSVLRKGDEDEDKQRRRQRVRRHSEETAETGPGIQLDEQTTKESQTIECTDNQGLTHTGEQDIIELPEDELWDETFKAELDRAMREPEPAANRRCTILCLDISASMAGEPWQEMGKALQDFVTALEDIRKNDDVEEQVAVVVFGHETRVAMPFTNQYNKIMDLFGSLVAGGCSPFLVGLQMCSMLYCVKKEFGKMNLELNGIPVKPRVIIFTDGHPTPTTIIGANDMVTEELSAKAVEAVTELDMEEDIKPLYTVSCIAVSERANVGLLEMCSSRTGGTTVPSLDVTQLASNTYSHYIAAHIGGPMLKKGDNKVDMKVFERLVYTLYPSISPRQMSEVKDIIQQEVERRTEETDSKGDNLQADIYFEHEELPPLGSNVQKGPDLDAEEGQYIPERGIVINHRCEDKGRVVVRWDNGITAECDYGNDNKYDVLPDENPKAHACSIDDPITVGCSVRRGPDWQFGNHDGGSDQLGTVYGVQPGGVVFVRWPNGNIGNYRYSMDNTYDVLISDPKDPYGVEFYTTEMNKRNLRAS